MAVSIRGRDIRCVWTETVDDESHEVAFDMHDWSGRFALRVDGQEMLAGRFSFHDQWRIFSGGGALLRFPLGGKQAQIQFRSAGMTWRADLQGGSSGRPTRASTLEARPY